MIEKQNSEPQTEQWLDLAEAAKILGVHFTTLRRWADAGKISHIRTPGGRRRFASTELEKYLQSLNPSGAAQTATLAVRTSVDLHERSEHSVWTGIMTEEERQKMRISGQRLLALLMQYNCRSDPGESFLDECRLMGKDYGRICCQANMSMVDTVNAFQYFRRSVLQSVHDTSFLNGENDPESQRIFQRTIHFLDTFLLEIVASYTSLQR